MIGEMTEGEEQMSVSFVWFDLGYTLVYMKREQVYQQVVQTFGYERSLEEIKKAYHVTDKLFMREYPGTLGRELGTFFPWYLGVLNHQLGVSIDLLEQMGRMKEADERGKQKWYAFDQVHSFLEELQRRGIRLGIISNWDHSARDVLETTQLSPFFEQVIISSEVGVEKPDARIFELALQRAGVLAEECLYVGDNYYDDVVGSSKVGMKAVLINPYGRLGMEEIAHQPLIRNVIHTLAFVSEDEVSQVVEYTAKN
jgi:putative hydrolase of the HAD superfamily